MCGLRAVGEDSINLATCNLAGLTLFLALPSNRIVEFTPGGYIDRTMTFDEYLESPEVGKIREELFQGQAELTL